MTSGEHNKFNCIAISQRGTTIELSQQSHISKMAKLNEE